MNSTTERKVKDIVDGVAAAAKPKRRRAAAVKPDPAAVASTAIAAAKKLVAAKRAAPVVAGAGNGQDYSAYHPISRSQQRLVSSPDALRGRVFQRAGTTPFERHPEITLAEIASIHKEIDNQGRCERLADLNSRVLREDAHTQAVDRIRRAIFRYPLLWKPRNKTTLAQLCQLAVQSVIEDIDGFQRTSGELLIANSGGFGAAEIVWKDKKIRIPTGRVTSLNVPVFAPSELQGVKNRWFSWDIQTDEPYIDQGGRNYVSATRDPDTGQQLHKLLLHVGAGDAGQSARHRGYQYANALLFALKGLGVEKWATLIEVCSVPTVYTQMPSGGGGKAPSPEAIDDAALILEDIGRGRPNILGPEFGEIKISPIPSANALHPGLIGYIETAQSKLILSSTLQVEVNGTGSYAAAETHADGQEAVQQIDADLECATYRQQLARSILTLNAENFARAFSPYVEGGCTPDDIRDCVPSCYREIRRETTQAQRMSVFMMAKNAGFKVSEDQVAEEMQLRTELPELTPLPQPVAAPLPQPEPEVRALPVAAPEVESACLMALLPAGVAAMLQPHCLPGYDLPLHITLGMFDRRHGLQQLGSAIASALGGLGPLAVTVGGGQLQTFEGDGVVQPVWAPVDAPELGMMRAMIVAATMMAGCPADDADRDYVPHVTLGYVPTGAAVPTEGVPAQTFVVRELVLAAGPEILARFPL